MTSPARIQRSRAAGWRMPADAVYVGRPGRWGNPYKVGDMVGPVHDCERVETPAQAVVLYDRWLRGKGPVVNGAEPRSSEGLDVTELAGRDLACWCPLTGPCHADVLLDLANRSA